ncbi:HepT-like ribonuclease domain-containing protein [Burkholderia anthina]|uniref:HepT-like ribonuclease domain-containing protein n=1 Tax=Burkholderia anthina TaxID=179879 RepID=UPI0030B94DCD
MPTPRERCEDILRSVQAILSEVNGRDEQAFVASDGLVAACCYRFVIIGEAASSLLTGCQSEIAQCPATLATALKYAKRMRDLLAHRYFAVDPAKVWATIQQDLRPLAADVAILQAKFP